MRKLFISASIALALGAGSAMADQATLDSLQAAGIVMTDEQAAAVLAAEGEQIADAVAAIVAANPSQAAAIVAAAVAANPEHTTAITAAAAAAAPSQASAIAAAAKSAQEAAKPWSPTSSGISVNSNAIPSTSGGGGSTSASPN